jgi:hypothetical protein
MADDPALTDEERAEAEAEALAEAELPVDVPNAPHRRTIDFKIVEALASKGCSDSEIAALVGCAESTLQTRARASLGRGRATMKLNLRAKQVALATGGKGNVTMLIWLGKQLLGQSDKVDHRDITDEELESKSDEELAALAAGKLRRIK